MTSLSGSLFYVLFVVSFSVLFGQCTAFSSTLTINEEEGELIWSTLIEGPIRGAPPITPDGTIYVKMHIGPDLPILAFDSNGQQIWHMNEPAGSTESSFKVGSDGTIYLLGGGLFIVLVLLAETTRTIAMGFGAVISWFGVIRGALTLSYTCHRVSQNTLSNLVLTLADKLTYENAGSSTYTESQWRFILNS